MILHFFVLTAAQCVTVVGMDNPEGGAGIAPRPIDSATPGNGININDNAVGFGVGDPVPLIGMSIVPYRCVNDPVWLSVVPGLVALLLTYPSALLETESIFLPDTDL